MPVFNDKSIQGIIDKVHAELPCLGAVADKSIRGIIDRAIAGGQAVSDISIQGIIDALSPFSCAPSMLLTSWFAIHAADADPGQQSFHGLYSVGTEGIGGSLAQYSVSSGTIPLGSSSSASSLLYNVSVRKVNYSAPGDFCRLFAFAHVNRVDGAAGLVKTELIRPDGSVFPASGTLTLVIADRTVAGQEYSEFALFYGDYTAAQAAATADGYNGMSALSQLPVNSGNTPLKAIATTAPADASVIDATMGVLNPQTPQNLKYIATMLPSASPSISAATELIVSTDDPTGNTYINSVTNDFKYWCNDYDTQSQSMTSGVIVFYFAPGMN